MKNQHCIFLALSFLTCLSAFGQACDCPQTQFAGTKPDTTFYLSNGKTIVLCGYKNPDDNPTTFSEFILAACGQDTIIDFWGAVLTCRLRTNKDTLLVDQLENLPTGQDFKFQQTVWTIERIYFNGQKTVRKLSVNRAIQKYNPTEITEVNNEFANRTDGLDDSKFNLLYKLFIATISGDKTARKNFKTFKTTFGELDGHFIESYSSLETMIKLWDKRE